MEYYGEGALLYDLVEHGLEGDTEFYVGEARKSKGKVLELGCGTGRVYLELLRKGINAYGLDVSERMLRELTRKAGEEKLNAKLKKAKMQSFRYPFKFDLIIIPYRGFNHVLTRKGQIECLRNVRKHLKPKGKLALDFFNPKPEMIRKGRLIEKAEFEQDDEKVSAVWTWRFEGKKPIAHLKCRIASPGKKPMEMSVKIQYVSKENFEGLLREVGFKRWKVFGGFGYETYSGNSQELVWAVER